MPLFNENADLTQERITSNSSQNSPLSYSKLPAIKFGRWFSRLKVGQKIGWGYGLALGMAVLGTTTGFLVADYYQQQAHKAQEDATEEHSLLNQLKSIILEVNLQQKQLILSLEKPELWQQEYSHFLEHEAKSRQVWSKFKGEQGYINHDIQESAGELEEIARLIQIYERLEIDIRKMGELLEKANPQKLPVKARQSAQTQLLHFSNEVLLFEFEQFSNQLNTLIEIASQEHEAADVGLVAAANLRVQIITFSLCVSVAIATIFAIHTSRAIARPIQATANVAQQVIKTSNFELRATVTSKDEVGELTTSLNQLIQRVQQLLQEQIQAKEKLEVYSYTLEQQVQQRTQELSEKNEFLEQTLQELKSTQITLIQSEKMSSLGQMVAGVAHEINNPVNFIYGNLTYVDEYTQDLLRILQHYQQHFPHLPQEIAGEIQDLDLEFVVEDLAKVLKSMHLGTARIREIVRSLRNFSRLDEAEVKDVNLHEGIDNTLTIVHYRLKAKPESPEIKVIKEYGLLPLVECYAGQLNQVFMNIISNAIDNLEEYNQQRTNQEIEANPSIIHIRTEVISDRLIVIRIADNGSGMTEEVRSKIFDPFFTTKAVGKGTGLGLSISYQIVVDKHGGKLSCDSAPGAGSEFVIQIPIQQQSRITA